MESADLYEEFLCYLTAERNYSPLTVSAYRSDGKSFLEHIATEGSATDIEGVTRQVVRSYVAWLHQRGLSSASIARRLCSLHSF